MIQPSHILSGLAIAGLIASPLAAATVTWDGTTDTAFFTGSNWVDDVAPTAGDTAIVNTLGLGNQPTISRNSNFDIQLNLLSGTVTAARSSGTNGRFTFTNGGGGLMMSGGNFNFTGNNYLEFLNSGTTLNLSAGTINLGASGTNRDLIFTNSSVLAMSGGVIENVANLELKNRTTVNMTDGSITSNSLSFTIPFINGSKAMNFSGGTIDTGAVTVNYDTSTKWHQINIAGGFVFNMTSLTFVSGADGSGLASTYFNFDSNWTGSMTIAGAANLEDYWQAFGAADMGDDVAEFLRVDGLSLANFNAFANVFNVNGSNALTMVPEPSTYALAAGALALGLAAYRRRKAA